MKIKTNECSSGQLTTVQGNQKFMKVHLFLRHIEQFKVVQGMLGQFWGSFE